MKDCLVARLSGTSPDKEADFDFLKGAGPAHSVEAGLPGCQQGPSRWAPADVLPRAVDRDHRHRRHTRGLAGLGLGPVLRLTSGHAAALPVSVLACVASRIASRLWRAVWRRGFISGSPLLVFWVVLGVPSAGGLLTAVSRASWACPIVAILWGKEIAEVRVVLRVRLPSRLGAFDLPTVAGLDERGWRPSGGMGNVIGRDRHVGALL